MDNFLSKSEIDYGDKYKEHFFKQYKIYIDGMEKTSDRRQQANNYFIAINTILTSLLGLSFQANLLTDSFWLRILLSILGIIISIIFYFLIKSYRQLNTGKFDVIHEMEKYLPISLYKYEWERLGKGQDKSKYYPFSHIEMLIPWIFGVLYFTLLIYFILSIKINIQMKFFLSIISLVFSLIGTGVLSVPLLKDTKSLDDSLVIDKGTKEVNGEKKYFYTNPGFLRDKKFGLWGLGFLFVGFLIQLIIIFWP